jgi:hypothetical protein
MKVTYTKHAAPAKRGTSEHLQSTTAQALIAAGLAIETERIDWASEPILTKRAAALRALGLTDKQIAVILFGDDKFDGAVSHRLNYLSYKPELNNDVQAASLHIMWVIENLLA